MGQLSVVLIRHDSIHLIEKDPEFAKKLVAACCTSRCENRDIDYGLTGVTVIGNYFSTHHTQIIVAEGGTAWAANFKGKPSWSKLERSYAMSMLFGPPKTKEKKEKKK